MFGLISKKSVKKIINKKIIEIRDEEYLNGKTVSWFSASILQKLKRELKL